MVRTALLAAALSAGTAAALAQPALYDPQQLPVIRGKVVEYSVTPRDTVDGLLLDDGTEVHLAERLSSELVFAVKPGDAVTVHGLRADNLPLVEAVSIANDRTGTTVVGTLLPAAQPPVYPGPAPAQTEARGVVRMQMHGPRGELDGVLLDDGTIVRLMPFNIQQRPDCVMPGQRIVAMGTSLPSVLGQVLVARSVLPDTGAPGPAASPGRTPLGSGAPLPPFRPTVAARPVVSGPGSQP